VRICIQSLEKMKKRAKNIFFKKIQYGHQKTQNFTLISNPLKKFEKNEEKNMTEICTFSTFTHVRQTCFAYNFFLVHFLKTFSTNLKSA
jgi:hypothetical protein